MSVTIRTLNTASDWLIADLGTVNYLDVVECSKGYVNQESFTYQ